MPKLIERTMSLNSNWFPDKHYLWSHQEIRMNWAGQQQVKDEYKIQLETVDLSDTIIVNCTFDEAVVLAALFMREVHDDIDNTFYDILKSKLYLHYGARGNGTIDDIERNKIVAEAEKRTIELINKHFYRADLLSIMMDRHGARLFSAVVVNKPEEEFVMGCA